MKNIFIVILILLSNYTMAIAVKTEASKNLTKKAIPINTKVSEKPVNQNIWSYNMGSGFSIIHGDLSEQNNMMTNLQMGLRLENLNKFLKLEWAFETVNSKNLDFFLASTNVIFKHEKLQLKQFSLNPFAGIGFGIGSNTKTSGALLLTTIGLNFAYSIGLNKQIELALSEKIYIDNIVMPSGNLKIKLIWNL